ncbi:MAG: hypothetical protein EPO30_10420 [Lysobacteraceae bacterium]|nr:MAG: hypothetical protein EPO30_10420 [Xanthomonadaceae bacterium]
MSTEYGDEGQGAPFDVEAFQATMAEHQRWAQLDVSLGEASEAVKDLCADLARFERGAAVSLVSALLTIPRYQSNCIRIELLVALAVLHCRGTEVPQISDLGRWFSEIGSSQCAAGEDPAEDVFVTLVLYREEQFLLLEGVWESAGFYTQRVLEVLETTPDKHWFAELTSCVRAGLLVSDLVCQRSGLRRYQAGSEVRRQEIDVNLIGSSDELRARILLPVAELEHLGITKEMLKPFILPPRALDEMAHQRVGLSALDRHPLIDLGETLLVAMPTALSIAIRNLVIETMVSAESIDAFDRVISIKYAELLSSTPLLGSAMHAPVNWYLAEHDRISSFIFEVDAGHVIAFHLFLPSARTHTTGGFKEIGQLSKALCEAIEQSMRGAEKGYARLHELRRGLHVVVGCGWGKGYSGEFSREGDSAWGFESMSAADLIRLSAIPEMTIDHFWRIEAGLHAAEAAGVEIVNLNGILNLFGWVRANHGHLVPHADLPEGRVSQDRPLWITPPLDLIRDVRVEADQSNDLHMAVDPAGKHHFVRRTEPNSLFDSESARRLYGCEDCVEHGELIALYEGVRSLWLGVQTPRIRSRSLHFKLWEMAAVWLHRIGYVIDPISGSGESLKLTLIFEDEEMDPRKVDVEPHSDTSGLCSYSVNRTKREAELRFGSGFMDFFRIPENVAERAVVRTMLRALLTLLQVPHVKAVAEELEPQIVLNDQARSFHIFHAYQYLDYVRGSLPSRLIEIEKIDDAMVRLGLGWRAQEVEENQITGKQECTQFLNRVAALVVVDIVSALSKYNRRATIERLLLNCLKAQDQEQHWKRTSAALIGLHGAGPKVLETVVEQVSRFTGAHVTSRVLVEVALCACPESGEAMPADIELSVLLARVSLLIRIGGMSDAIHYNVLEPRLAISSLGDILVRDDFGREIVEPMLSQAIGEGFVEGAPKQRRNYQMPKTQGSTREAFGEMFYSAWQTEMGFTIDDAREMIDAVEHHALASDRLPIFSMRRSELEKLLSPVTDNEKAKRFVSAFLLSPRPQWDKPPSGFARRDIYPWRFGRRLSVVTRPLVQIDETKDPAVFISPDLLRKGFAYVIDQAFNGTLDPSFFSSDQMRNEWLGVAGEGHTFNHEVAELLMADGWTARENVGLPEVLNRKLVRDYGDIDVLAWRADRDEVLVIECKDLSFARNASEIAALLSDYQGRQKGGKPDKLLRHLERFRLLEAESSVTSRVTGKATFRLTSCLVTSRIVPMQFAKIDALSGSFVGTVKSLLERLRA